MGLTYGSQLTGGNENFIQDQTDSNGKLTVAIPHGGAGIEYTK